VSDSWYWVVGLATAAAVGLFTVSIIARPVNTRFMASCQSDTAERRSTFILECAKAANPLSDEEGEDLVKQCQATAADLFCPKEKFVQVSDYEWQHCGAVTDIRHKEACK
jgi:hypothetical protein